ncbi:hypothetical protein QYG89_15865 [Bacillus sp. B190/17]|uniref:Uncharacterized protein n=1 Tax=Bacillus lumedeiriae TaxID=3058829 RepID=A0ABW8IC74_9BACI
MFCDSYVTQFVHSTIKKVWLEDIHREYKKSFLLKEDTLKNSFYFNLRRRLGDDFLEESNLRIFTEYFIDGERIDLAVVKIDPIKAQNDYLGNCVTKVISVIEMKYKGKYAREALFDADVNKVLSYMDKLDGDTMFYIAFIREIYFNSDEVTNWVTDEQKKKAKGKLTEMFSYGEIESNDMIWHLIEH